MTVDGKSYPLPEPFTVIATQNPVGAAGTQLLPDSQLDRFMVRLSIGYPSPRDERDMVLSRQGGNPLAAVKQVISRSELVAMQQAAEAVYAKEEVVDYIVSLIAATRSHEKILRGASPRATLAVTAMAKSVAYLSGRDYLVPEDVRLVFADVVSHRLLLTPEAEMDGVQARDLVEKLLARVPAPRLR